MHAYVFFNSFSEYENQIIYTTIVNLNCKIGCWSGIGMASTYEKTTWKIGTIGTILRLCLNVSERNNILILENVN